MKWFKCVWPLLLMPAISQASGVGIGFGPNLGRDVIMPHLTVHF